MPQILKNATVLALDRPDSLQAQCGFPTKLGEYLLTENPVVVTKVGDIPLFLKDGETALLAEERNPYEFSSKLLWALDHPAEAIEIGKAGAQVAMREFNYLNETKRLLKPYNNMKVLVAGDFCQRFRVNEKIEQKEFGSMFDTIKPIISACDIKVVNFEFPIVTETGKPSRRLALHLKDLSLR